MGSRGKGFRPLAWGNPLGLPPGPLWHERGRGSSGARLAKLVQFWSIQLFKCVMQKEMYAPASWASLGLHHGSLWETSCPASLALGSAAVAVTKNYQMKFKLTLHSLLWHSTFVGRLVLSSQIRSKSHPEHTRASGTRRKAPIIFIKRGSPRVVGIKITPPPPTPGNTSGTRPSRPPGWQGHTAPIAMRCLGEGQTGRVIGQHPQRINKV